MEFTPNIKKELSNLESLSHRTLFMGSSNKYLSKYIPQFYIDSGNYPINYLTKSYFLNLEVIRFRELIESYLKSHEKQDSLTQMNLNVDPWENYEFHDSKLIFDMILAEKKNKITYVFEFGKYENCNQNMLNTLLDNYIMLKFIDYIHLKGINNQLYAKGSRLIDQLYIFINQILKRQESELKDAKDDKLGTKEENNKDLSLSKILIEMIEIVFNKDLFFKNTNILKNKDELILDLNNLYVFNESDISKECLQLLSKYEEIESALFRIFDEYCEKLKEDNILKDIKNDYFV